MRGRSIALGVSTRGPGPAHTSQFHTDCCPASQFNRVKLETIKASLGPRGSVRGRGNRYGDSEGGELEGNATRPSCGPVCRRPGGRLCRLHSKIV